MKFFFIFILYSNLNVDLTVEIIFEIKIDPLGLETPSIPSETFAVVKMSGSKRGVRIDWIRSK
jgi:hypothetical protein